MNEELAKKIEKINVLQSKIKAKEAEILHFERILKECWELPEHCFNDLKKILNTRENLKGMLAQGINKNLLELNSELGGLETLLKSLLA